MTSSGNTRAKELTVDWSALHNAFQMNTPEVQSFFSLEDGKVYKHPKKHPITERMRAQRDTYVPITAVPSHIQYQWVDAFIRTIADAGLRDQMREAVNGKGAFRRFKDILLTVPDERRRWFEFRDRCVRERLVEWVKEQGVEPLNPPPWQLEDGQGEPTARNRTVDVEALRDLLIEWHEGRDASQPKAAELENLAWRISERFLIQPK